MRRVYVGGAFASVAAIVATWIAIGVGGGGGVSKCPAPKYPDATCTGVPSGVTLTPYTGPNPVVADNAVIDGVSYEGTLEVRGGNVTIRNSYITGTVYNDSQRSYGKEPLHLEDSVVDCGGVGGSGVVEANMVIRRVRIRGCENGMSLTANVDMRDSFLEHLIDLGGTEAHEDGIQFGCGHYDPAATVGCAPGYGPGALNITLVHNTIFGMNGDGSFGTSGIITNPNGIDTNILIQDNLLAGGGYTLYCTAGKPPENPIDLPMTAHNFRVIGNHFSTRYSPNVGFFGPSTNCDDEIQSGNVIHETGAPLSLP
jgi:hypothetical protein